MKKNIAKTIYGSAILAEATTKLAKSSSASDVMYYICRVLGIELPLPVALAARILLLTTGGFALLDGLKGFSQEALQKETPQV